MLKAELKKIRSFHSVIILVLLLLFLHIMLLIYQAVKPNELGFSSRDIGRIYHEMGQNEIEFIEHRKIEVIASINEAGNDQERIDSLASQMSLLHQIEREVNLTATYAEHLEGIAKDAEQLQRSTILFQDKTFSARNILDIAEAYSRLERSSLSWCPSEGVLLITGNSYTDILILFSMIILCLALTTSERMLGYHAIIRTAPNGCNRSWLYKLRILIVLAVGITALFYIISFYVSYHLIGWNPALPVQSMISYYNCPYEMTISQFLLVFLILKTLAIICLSVLVFALGCIFSDLLRPAACVIIGIIISYILWHRIDRSSWLGILKEFNVIALLDTKHYFETAVNVNVAEYPLSAVSAGIIFACISFIISIPISKYYWKRILETDCPTVVRSAHRIHESHTKSLLFCEVEKLLLTNHALLIWGVMAVMLALGLTVPNEITETQYFYRQYVDVLEGSLSEEKAEFLEKEAAHIAEANAQISMLSEKLSEGEILPETFAILSSEWDIPLSKQSAFYAAYDQYMELAELQAGGYQVEFLDETGWILLFSEWGKAVDTLNGLLIGIVLVLSIHNYAAMEVSTGVNVLISCSPNGPARTKSAKYLSAILYAMLAAPYPYINQLFQINSEFPLENFSSFHLSIGSVTAIDSLLLWCPVAGYISFRIASIMVEAVLCSVVILHISERMKSAFASLSCGLFALGINFVLAICFRFSPILSGRELDEGWIVIVELVVVCKLIRKLVKKEESKKDVPLCY